MSKKASYIRIGVFGIDEVLPYVFTRHVRHTLIKEGYTYNSQEWKNASKHTFKVRLNGVDKTIEVAMGSHRYQLYVEKGVTCVSCGIEGKYFALERGYKNNPNKFHFNLYGINKSGHEIMLTKDHIIPRSKGGKNRLENYQPMCLKCNQKKADKIPC